MPPRFPQEIFDEIIDQAVTIEMNLVESLRAHSLVSKGWLNRSRSIRFEEVLFHQPTDLERWCEKISPSPDGPGRYVKTLEILSGVIPLVSDPQQLEKYIDHFTSFTQVENLILAHHKKEVHFDAIARCFSGFRNSVLFLEVNNSSFSFDELSQIMELFPNLVTMMCQYANLGRPSEDVQINPPRQASFKSLSALYLVLTFEGRQKLEFDQHLLSGFTKASMENLELLGVRGKVPDLLPVQELVNSKANTLTTLRVQPLGRFRSKLCVYKLLILLLFLACRPRSFCMQQPSNY